MDYYPRIRNMREDNDKRQQDIADCLGISRNMYRRYEMGETDIPARHLIKLAALYKTSTDYLISLTDEKPPYPRKKFVVGFTD